MDRTTLMKRIKIGIVLMILAIVFYFMGPLIDMTLIGLLFAIGAATTIYSLIQYHEIFGKH